MDMLLTAVAFAINVAILFFVVRKATRADVQIDLLRRILATQKPEEKSEIVKLTEERSERYAK